MHLARPLSLLATLGITVISLGACAPATPAESTPPQAEAAQEATLIRFALDWSLNTNHIGLVIAEELGLFEEADLAVELLPIAPITPVEQISAGEADFGISEQTGIQIARTQGHAITSVYQVVQRETGVVIFDDNRSDITRPADLDGLIYGGFGDPIWAGIAAAVISGDGGSGTFDEIVPETDLYEAVHTGDIDFTLSVVNWENILAEMEGRPYGVFRYQDYGVPENHTISIVGSDDFLSTSPEATRGFVQAVQQGYKYAVEHPAESAQILIEAYPELFGDLTELVHASTELMASEYFVADGVPIGAAQPHYWDEYGDFLLERGMITDADGAQVETTPDWIEYYTNEFLNY